MQACIEDSSYISFNPVSTISDNGPLEFYIPRTREYTDIANSYLALAVQIVKKNGRAVASTDGHAELVNLPLHGLFSQVDISLNNATVSQASNTYAHRAYILTLLGYDREAKHGFLQCSGFSKDTAGAMDEHAPTHADAKNTGLKERYQWTKESTPLQLCGRLQLDICYQDKLLIPGIDIKLKLIRSLPQFHLMSTDDDFKVRSQEAMLLSVALLHTHEFLLLTKNFCSKVTKHAIQFNGAKLKHLQ